MAGIRMSQKQLDALGVKIPREAAGSSTLKKTRIYERPRESALVLQNIVARADCTYFVLPLPPKILSPNCGRWHWRTHAKAAKAYERACLYTMKKSGISFINSPVTLHFEFYMAPFPADGAARFKDKDNALASVKKAIDALVLAGIIKNDSAEFVRYGDVKLRGKQAEHEGFACLLLIIERLK